MALTYTQLVQNIQDYTENDDTEFVTSIDTIIANAENRIHRETALDRWRKYATTTMSTNARFLAKPTDYVVDRFMYADAGSGKFPIDPKDTSFIETFHPLSTATGTPRWYSDWDEDTFLVAPTLDADHTITLAYKYKPTGLSSSNANTWIGDNAQDLILYACIEESYGWMKTTENLKDIDYWITKYNGALASLILQEQKRNRTEQRRHGEEI